MTTASDKLKLASAMQVLEDESAAYMLETAPGWLRQARQEISNSEDTLEELGLYSAMAHRKLGDRRLEDASVVDTTFSPLDIRRWSVTDVGRLILLMHAINKHPDEIESLIHGYYKMGDESEKIALLQGLIYFAPGEYLNEIALDAGRTNNLEVLAALTLDNPYPACFYSEHAFNQMVLKGLFLGLAIERVHGIEQRANPDLTRMCENYVIERENAFRSVPVDIWLAIAPFASQTGRQQMIEYNEHEDVGHRYYTSLAMLQRLSQDAELEPVLRHRLEEESEPMIRKLLQDTLQPKQ